MKTKKLTEVLERIEAWPPEAQNALADFALDLDAGFKAGDYEPTAEELAGIDRGLRDAVEGRLATPQQIEDTFAKLRGEKAVEQLPPHELTRFRAWFEAFDADQFDAAIERDAQAGKLDALAEEALAKHRAGGTRQL
jgi:predicted transcriptional regulator